MVACASRSGFTRSTCTHAAEGVLVDEYLVAMEQIEARLTELDERMGEIALGGSGS